MSLIRPSRCLPAVLIRWRSGRKASASEVLGLLLEHLGVADDGVQWRPQLVAHIREELRLVLRRLSKLTVRYLKLLEEARVLDGNHGLIGERFEQGDLTLGEWPDVGMVHRNDAKLVILT